MKTKVLAYYPLHYGSEYLKESLLSIIENVDKVLFLYTATPSYGQTSDLHNPDTEENLKKIAHSVCGDKMEWVQVSGVYRENIHRNLVFGYAESYDLIMAVDADEVWENLPLAIAAAMETKAKNINVAGSQWYHFWRSFNEVNRDAFAPTRFHCVRSIIENATIHCGIVYHFGYAQSEQITEYKISIHGHQSILKSWVFEKFKSYEKGVTKFLHPDSQTVWIETEPFDKTLLPFILQEHPNWYKSKIA